MAIKRGAGKIGTTRFNGRTKYARGRYSFAVDGGAVGDITLRGDSLPAGAIIVEALVKVTTPPTSGGAATIAVKTEGAADVNAADAISGAPWSAAGAVQLDKTTNAGSRVLTTATRPIKITVGTAALTAGVFDVVVGYIELS